MGNDMGSIWEMAPIHADRRNTSGVSQGHRTARKPPEQDPGNGSLRNSPRRSRSAVRLVAMKPCHTRRLHH